jgi:hypothetical protein
MLRPVLIIAAALFAGAAAAQEAPPPSAGAAATGAAHAPPSPEMRAARKAARQACMPDATKLCASVEPGHGALMQCLRAHRADLSEGCGSALRAVREARRTEG